jgi:tetratricopeptide (TPR) repeat protein
MINPTSTDPGKVVLVPRRPRSAVVLGEETILAPKLRFEINMGDGEEAAKLAAFHRHISESNARRVLDDIASESDKRTLRFPGSPSAWTQAGLAHLARGDYAAADAAFESALRLDPKCRGALLGRARTANETGNSEFAMQILEEFVRQNPMDLEAVVALAVVVADVDSPVAALAKLQFEPPVIPRASSFFAARGSLNVALGNYEDAIRDLRKVIRMKPDWVQARNVLGIAELKAGHLSAAERRFREAVRIAPMYLEGFLNLLRVLIRQKRFDVVLDLSHGRYSDVANAPAPVGRIVSQAALELEQWQEARRWLESALGKTQDPPTRARLLNDLGVSYDRVGKHSEAERQFASSVESAPSEIAIVNRGKALLSSGRSIEAASWLRTAPFPESGPSDSRLFTLAVSLNVARMHADAASIYESLVSAREPNRFVFADLAAIYTDNLADAAKAIGFAETGLRSFPSDPLLVNNLAYALLMFGQVDSAARVLSTPVVPNETELVCLMATRGLLELRRGNIAEGKRLYNEAIGLSGKRSIRERAKAKRDLEVARALIRSRASTDELVGLLREAASAPEDAYPYQLQASNELKLLRGGDKNGGRDFPGY